MTTGGMINGRWTTTLSSDLPQNRTRASSSAMAMPTGRLHAIAQKATRSDRRIAVISSGEKERSALTATCRAPKILAP